jgi:hypothetical protein
MQTAEGFVKEIERLRRLLEEGRRDKKSSTEVLDEKMVGEGS